MWHEARKQERMIRGMIVDYRRRAERRKNFYEKIKAEPTQFLQLHGRPCKIHLDPMVAAAGDSPAIMMPWQGDTNNLIDRFDVRAHLDYIPDVKVPDVSLEDLSTEERQCNYERYRILAQNQFLGIGEDKFLHQLAVEEKFGITIEERESYKDKLLEQKGTGAAIGYNYNDPGAQPSCSTGPEIKTNVEQKDSDDDSDLEIIDVDLSIDVNKMEASQAHELNGVGPLFGMAGCDLFSFLTGDADDAEHQKQLLREEKEKAMFSGRKSRRERRAHRDKKLLTRVLSPPSYAAPSAEAPREPSRSPSRSPSPRGPEHIQFITSFGGDEDESKQATHAKSSYADKVKHNLKKMEVLYADVARGNKTKRSPVQECRTSYNVPFGPQKPRSRSRSFSRSRSRSSRSRSRSKSRSRPRGRPRSYSRSKSRSYSPRYRSYSRSRSRSRVYQRRSRSRSYTNYTRSNRSRSLSYDSDKHQNKTSVPRYYGRKKDEKQSSSEISYDSDSSNDNDSAHRAGNGGKFNTNQSQLRSGSGTKGPSRETISLKEKLRRKMQVQLSRQLRADKRAEAARVERESRRQARRDEEMRELAIKLRRKQREMRHQQNQRSSDDSDGSGSRSSSRGSRDGSLKRKSISRSPSPPKRNVVVWEADERKKSPERHDEPNSSHTQDNIKRPPPNFRDNRSYRSEENRSLSYHGNRYDPQNREEGRPELGHGSRWEHEGHGSRFDHEPQGSYRRRPYGHRGGYRGHIRRFGHPDQPEESTSRNNDIEYDKKDGNPGTYSKNKVKLVDY